MPIDMSAAKAPPRKRANSTSVRSSTVAQHDTRTDNEKRAEGLNGVAALGQGLCLMMGQYADAAAVGQHFGGVAKELANIADTSEIVAKPIDFIIEVGPYGALIAAAMPLVMQIMANHNVLDASRLAGQGVVPPAVLDAQMKAQVARMQADALKAQQLAMKEAQEAQQDYERFMQEATQAGRDA